MKKSGPRQQQQRSHHQKDKNKNKNRNNNSSDKNISTDKNNNKTYVRNNKPSKSNLNTNRDREPSKILISRLPVGTRVEEIRELLQGWIFDISINDVHLLAPSLSAVVEFDGDEWVHRVVDYFCLHKQRVGTCGYFYTNWKGATDEIDVQYSFKEKPVTPTVKQASKQQQQQQQPESSKPSSFMKKVSEEITDIKHQRADFLNNMMKIEDQLKKRIPDLFVSELELCDLQREEYEIQEKIKAQSVQLSNAKVCLKGVLEDMSMLQCYSDDDQDDLAQLNI